MTEQTQTGKNLESTSSLPHIHDKQDILIIRFYSIAHAYHETCELLESNVNFVPNVRFVLNSLLAFNTEISLKTILAMDGKTESDLKKLNHNLASIVDALGENNISALSAAFENAYLHKLGKTVDFRELVSQNSDNFMKWRYLQQINDLDNIEKHDTNYNYEFLCNLEMVSYGICDNLHNLYLEDLEKRLICGGDFTPANLHLSLSSHNNDNGYNSGSASA